MVPHREICEFLIAEFYDICGFILFTFLFKVIFFGVKIIKLYDIINLSKKQDIKIKHYVLLSLVMCDEYLKNPYFLCKQILEAPQQKHNFLEYNNVA